MLLSREAADMNPAQVKKFYSNELNKLQVQFSQVQQDLSDFKKEKTALSKSVKDLQERLAENEKSMAEN